MKRVFIKIAIIAAILFAALALLSIRKSPERISYGASFSVFHSRELGLDWKTVYDAILQDLGVRMFRFSAHWPLTEPEKGNFNWTELDYQIKEAETYDAQVTLAVGRRLPGWPECHEPEWVKSLSKEEKQTAILTYITEVVNRYKNSPAISTWQIENEPFLTFFSRKHCADFFDKDFLTEEIKVVRALDPSRPILITDSGELGLWYNAYSLGDEFGTSVYIYIWNQYVGPIRYPITPAFFRIKANLVQFFKGKKPISLIELSAEPWLLQSIVDTPIDTALGQMDIEKFNHVLSFAKKTSFENQYLWGAEWWFYMKEHEHPEFWEKGREIFNQEKSDNRSEKILE